MMFSATDPRLLVHDVMREPIPAQSEWERQDQRYRIYAMGTKTLGYVYMESVRSDGGIHQEYRATARDGAELGMAANLTDGAALVVAAAHTPPTDTIL